jgi:hypothetical protein
MSYKPSIFNPEVEEAIKVLAHELFLSKGWAHGYADAIIRDAIDRKHIDQYIYDDQGSVEP